MHLAPAPGCPDTPQCQPLSPRAGLAQMLTYARGSSGPGFRQASSNESLRLSLEQSFPCGVLSSGTAGGEAVTSKMRGGHALGSLVKQSTQRSTGGLQALCARNLVR